MNKWKLGQSENNGGSGEGTGGFVGKRFLSLSPPPFLWLSSQYLRGQKVKNTKSNGNACYAG